MKAKGSIKTGGRLKGTPNKVNGGVKAALTEAFERLGGVSGFVEWGKTEPSEFYKLWAKLIPTEVKIDPESNKLVVEIVQFTAHQ